MEGHGRRQGGGPSCTLKPWKGYSGTIFISSSCTYRHYHGAHRTPSGVPRTPTACYHGAHRTPSGVPRTPPACIYSTAGVAEAHHRSSDAQGLSSFVRSFGWLLIKSCWPELCWCFLGRLSEFCFGSFVLTWSFNTQRAAFLPLSFGVIPHSCTNSHLSPANSVLTGHEI